MDAKHEYRRDSSDNVHVIYQAPVADYNKAFDSYVPPRYTEKGLVPAPTPPPAPVGPLPERRIMGLKRRTFWIALALFALLVIGVAVGAGVGVAAATKKKDDGLHPPEQDQPEGAGAPSPTEAPVTVTMTPSPTTFVTSTIPTSSAVPIKHCQQMWEGTSPFCSGKCDVGWTAVRENDVADQCDESLDTLVIDSCANLSDNSCWTGSKVLCERCHTEGEEAGLGQ